MFQKKIYFLASFIFLLVGCGGGTVNSADDIQLISADEQKVVGIWEPQNASNFVYEFFPSNANFPYDFQFKTGRRYKDGVVDSFFYWNVQRDGTTNLTMVPTSCEGVPLTSCSTSGLISIVAQGKSLDGAKWSFAFDENSDGISDKKISDTYRRKVIDLDALNRQGEFFLQFLKYYDQPISGELNNKTISVKLNYFEKPITLSAEFDVNKKSAIEFQSDKNLAITLNKEFFVRGQGYRNFLVKSWYEKVTLNSSASGSYVLSFEVHNEVQVPADIDKSALVLDGFETVLALSRVCSVVNSFVSVPEIKAMDRFFSVVPDVFNESWVLSGMGNTLNFTSDSMGNLAHTDIHKDFYSEHRDFTWSVSNDVLALTLPSYGVISFRFIKIIDGGYSVLIASPDSAGGYTYKIQDWIKDAPPVVDELTLPGRYRILGPNGLAGPDEEIFFHADKTVSGNGIGGYWFQDTDGDIVSYECVDLYGRDISNYFECFSTFDNLFNVKFSHVRRIRFLHKDGNNYQSKYDAVIYGIHGPFYFPERLTIAYTYRWTRVGD